MYRAVLRVSVAQDGTVTADSGTCFITAHSLRLRPLLTCPDPGNLSRAGTFDKPILSTDISSSPISQPVPLESGSTSPTDAG